MNLLEHIYSDIKALIATIIISFIIVLVISGILLINYNNKKNENKRSPISTVTLMKNSEHYEINKPRIIGRTPTLGFHFLMRSTSIGAFKLSNNQGVFTLNLMDVRKIASDGKGGCNIILNNGSKVSGNCCFFSSMWLTGYLYVEGEVHHSGLIGEVRVDIGTYKTGDYIEFHK